MLKAAAEAARTKIGRGWVQVFVWGQEWKDKEKKGQPREQQKNTRCAIASHTS